MYEYRDTDKLKQHQLINAQVEAFLAKGGTIKNLDKDDAIIVDNTPVKNKSLSHAKALKSQLIKDLICHAGEKGYLTRSMIRNKVKERGLDQFNTSAFNVTSILQEINKIEPLKRFNKPEKFRFVKDCVAGS